MRINKFVAAATGASRREADVMISRGEISINGTVATLGQTVTDDDTVTQGGALLQPQKSIYVLVNKPIGYVCSRRSQDNKPTIYELLPEAYQRLKTAGRLDADSSGLVLLTNDGDFAQQLTHPKYAKVKRYEVTLDHPLSADDRAQITTGVALEDGISRFDVHGEKPLLVTMTEGRNRQIRRTFDALGYNVEKLHRIKFGEYDIADLSNKVYASVERKLARKDLPTQETNHE